MNFLDGLKYDERGLAPAIVQDADSGEVLMLGYVNREALVKALETGQMHFYSRRRRRLWRKGEQSGHTQQILELRVDCDADVALVKVRQKGGACHTGYRSCFYRLLEPLAAGGRLVESGQKVFEPGDVYKSE